MMRKIEAFVRKYSKYIGSLTIPGIEKPFEIHEDFIRTIANTFLFAANEAWENI